MKKNPPTLNELLLRTQRSGVPKYVVLRDALLELIKAGQWKPGAKFLSEDELLARTPYSLGTIQRAMRSLVDSRILIRRQGLGSFVADLPRRLDHSRHCKFVNDSGQDFVPIYSKVTSRAAVKDIGAWSRFLGDAQDGYLRIDRLISIDNEFLVASRFYCVPEVLPYLQYCPVHELNGANFVALIAKHCNIHVRSLGSYVTIKTFPKEICKEIKLKPGKPGMFVQATARTADDLYVYFQEFYIPPTGRALHFSEEVAFVPERHFDLA